MKGAAKHLEGPSWECKSKAEEEVQIRPPKGISERGSRGPGAPAPGRWSAPSTLCESSLGNCGLISGALPPPLNASVFSRPLS